MTRTLIALTVLVSAAMTGTAWGHGGESRKEKEKSAQVAEEKPFGRPGDPGKVTRTIRIDMLDGMRFVPGDLKVKKGETIRFIVANKGKIMHEMVIGTMQELKEHAELMKKHPGMEHDAPYMAHVAPGKTRSIVWQFNRTGDFHYACLIAGHMEAGMVNRINVATK